ncbi:MAG: hypothetical protein NTV22_08710 [bacterium]|nr:hypothetical protein [bacterium]
MSTHACWRSLLLLCFIVLASRADWNEGQDFKMHWPQLPNPNGWDIDVTHYTLADDWLCTGTGPVKQVHLWISWTNDFVGVITNVHLSIHNDIPAVPNPPTPSRPAMPAIWQDNFGPGQFKMRPYSSGLQGWYDPVSNTWRRPDHTMIFQLNVPLKITMPFSQNAGTIYWLDVKLSVTNGLAGWKTSGPASRWIWPL